MIQSPESPEILIAQTYISQVGVKRGLLKIWIVIDIAELNIVVR